MKRLILAALFLFLTAPVHAETQKLSLKLLIDQFNAVVFIHEHGKKGREEKPLIKWTRPFVFSPSGKLSREQVLGFFNLMKQVKRLTNIDMRVMEKGEKSDLIVHFVPLVELQKKLKPGINCYGTIKTSTAYEIQQATAFLPSDRPDKTMHCLVEETVQLFGLTNDSTIIADSMFHEESTRTSLSVSDQILLKALYDPRLKAGMTKEEAQPVLRIVMQEILENALKKQKGE